MNSKPFSKDLFLLASGSIILHHANGEAVDDLLTASDPAAAYTKAVQQIAQEAAAEQYAQEVPRGIDAELNPESSKFNLDAWQKAVEFSGGFEALAAVLDDFKRTIERYRTPGEFEKDLTATLTAIDEQIKELEQPEKEVEEANRDIAAIIGETEETKENAITKQIKELRELQELLKKYAAIFEKIPLQTTATRPDKTIFPLDKVTTSYFKNLISKDGANINTGGKNRKNALVYCALDFDSLPGVSITKTLTAYDKIVYIAAANLYAYNEITTATQIYKAMGNTGTPRASDLKKINDSLAKMRRASVTIDNAEEHKAFNGGYPLFTYNGQLLPLETISATINGKPVETAIHLLREPPLISFAKKHNNQIATLPRAVLESPVNKTETALTIQDFLFRSINHMKNRKTEPRNISFETLFKECKAEEKKQRQRARETMQKLLDHYTACGWIKGYSADKKGVKIDP